MEDFSPALYFVTLLDGHQRVSARCSHMNTHRLAQRIPCMLKSIQYRRMFGTDVVDHGIACCLTLVPVDREINALVAFNEPA